MTLVSLMARSRK